MKNTNVVIYLSITELLPFYLNNYNFRINFDIWQTNSLPKNDILFSLKIISVILEPLHFKIYFKYFIYF